MAEEKGVENIKRLLKFVADFTNQIAKTKKFRLLTLLSFVDDLAELGEIIPLWPEIKAEYKDRSEAEKQEIYAYVRNELDLPNDEAEAFVEDCFQWADYTISLVNRAKRLKKK
jgi:hypothetical protein